MPNPILPERDIRSAVDKMKAYLKAHPVSEKDIESTGSNYYCQARLTMALPRDFPIDGSNKNELAAFARLLHSQDDSLHVDDIYYDKGAQRTYLIIQNTKFIGMTLSHTDADERQELKPLADIYKQRLSKALTQLSKQDSNRLAHTVTTELGREMRAVDDAYTMTRSATETGFNTHKNVVVYANQVNDPTYIFKFRAALDGADKKEAPPQAIILGVDNPSIVRIEHHQPADYLYAEVIRHSVKLKEKYGTHLAGNDARHPKVDWEQANNQAKTEADYVYNVAIFKGMENTQRTFAGKKTLTLMTDYPSFPPDALVLNGAPEIANDANRLAYYALRFHDGQECNTPFSRENMVKRYQAMNQEPAIDISNHGRVLYLTPEMQQTMYEQAKLHYSSNQLKPSEKMPCHDTSVISHPPAHGIKQGGTGISTR